MLGDITDCYVRLNDKLYFDVLYQSGKIKLYHWYQFVIEYAGRVVQVVASFPETDEYRVILKGERVLLNSTDFSLIREEK